MEGQQLSVVAWGLVMLNCNDGKLWAAIESAPLFLPVLFLETSVVDP